MIKTPWKASAKDPHFGFSLTEPDHSTKAIERMRAIKDRRHVRALHLTLGQSGDKAGNRIRHLSVLWRSWCWIYSNACAIRPRSRTPNTERPNPIAAVPATISSGCYNQSLNEPVFCAEELCQQLVDEVQQLAATKDFADDVCLIAMEIDHLRKD